jgi:thiol-disulfide isomerase/thioredoxin
LAELARRARAKKQGAAKPAKILDDDNFQRTQYAADKALPGTEAAGPDSGKPSSGKLVLLDFWASWCGPCRSALPSLKRLQATYGDRVQIISISEDDDESTWQAFVANNDMRWEQRFDADGRMRARYGVDALPTYILLGPDHKVIQRLEGEDPTQYIAKKIGPNPRGSADGPR